MKLLFESNATRRAIIVIALGFLALALAYSARAALGLAMPIWETQLDWSRNYVSNVAAIALLVMALVAPVSGYLLDRKGLRFTLLVDLLAVCLSSILVSLAESRWLLFVGFGVIGMIGVGWLTDRMNRPLLLGCIYLIRSHSWFSGFPGETEVRICKRAVRLNIQAIVVTWCFRHLADLERYLQKEYAENQQSNCI
jgi:MFS family permease